VISLNKVISNIKSRRSIRRYKDKKLSKKEIMSLIEAGSYAPSSHNRQPWEFVVLTGSKIDELSAEINNWYSSFVKLGRPLSFIKEIKESVDAMKKRVESDKDLFFYHAPCVVIVHAPKKRFYLQDCSCAAQNMMLAARSLSIGSCWIGFADIVLNRSRKIKKKLGIPMSHGVMATIAFGYTDRFPSKALPRREFKVEFV
jgi:nitroreductase